MINHIKHILRHNSIIGAIFWLPRKVRIILHRLIPDLVERRIRRVVRGGGVVIRPTNIGLDFEVDPLSDISMRVITTGEYEPEFINAINAFVGPQSLLVVNIGANVGMIALHVASRFPQAKVWAFEPNASAHRMLKSNIDRNGFSGRVLLENCCLGETDGYVSLATVEGRSEYSSIGGIVHPAVRAEETVKIEVPIRRLDEFDFKGNAVSCLIIDTEGAEGMVLRGGLRVIREFQPLILFECEDRLLKKFGDSAESICSMLEREGYQIRNALFPDRKVEFPFTGEILAFVE